MSIRPGWRARLPWGLTDASIAAAMPSGRTGRALRGSAAGIAARLIAVLASIITVPVLLGYLGAEGYGLWVTAGTVVAWVGLLNLGLPPSLLNRVAGTPAERTAARQRSVSAAWWMSVALAILSVLLLLLLDRADVWSSLLNTSDPDLMATGRVFVLVMWIGVAVYMPLSLPMALMRANQAVDRAAAIDAGVSVLRAIGIIVAVHLAATVGVLVAFAVALPMVALAVVAWRSLGPASKGPRVGTFDGSEAGALLSSGIGFSGMALAALFITSVDVLIVVQLMGPSAVPTYSVAFALFMLFVGIQVAVLDGLWPGYRDAFSRGERDWIERIHRRTTLALLGSALVFGAGLVAFGQVVIEVWAGSAAVPPHSLLLVLAVVAALQAVELSHARILVAAGRVRRTTTLSLIGAAINIPVSVLLGAALGVTGVALGTLCAYAAIGWVIVRDARQSIRSLAVGETQAGLAA